MDGSQRVTHTADVAIVNGHSVNHDQRIVRGRHRRTATDADGCAATRSTTVGNHADTRRLTDEHIGGRCHGSLYQFVCTEGSHATRQVVFLHTTIADNYHFLQGLRVILHADGDRGSGQSCSILVAHIRDGQLVALIRL